MDSKSILFLEGRVPRGRICNCEIEAAVSGGPVSGELSSTRPGDRIFAHPSRLRRAQLYSCPAVFAESADEVVPRICATRKLYSLELILH